MLSSQPPFHLQVCISAIEGRFHGRSGMRPQREWEWEWWSMMIDDGDDGVEEDNARLSFVRWSPAVRVLSLSLLLSLSLSLLLPLSLSLFVPYLVPLFTSSLLKTPIPSLNTRVRVSSVPSTTRTVQGICGDEDKQVTGFPLLTLPVPIIPIPIPPSLPPYHYHQSNVLT